MYIFHSIALIVCLYLTRRRYRNKKNNKEHVVNIAIHSNENGSVEGNGSTIELSGDDDDVMNDIVKVIGLTPMGPEPINDEVRHNITNPLMANDDLHVDNIINQEDDEEILQMIDTPMNGQDEFIIDGDSDDGIVNNTDGPSDAFQTKR